MYTTQTRTLNNPVSLIEYVWPPAEGGPFVPAYPAPAAIVPYQTTYSFRTTGLQNATEREIVKDWYTIRKNGFTSLTSYDTGHDFWTTKVSHRFSHPRWIARWTYQNSPRAYRGPLVPNCSSGTLLNFGQYPALSRMSNSEIGSWSASFIASTMPTKPSASLAVFLGELRDFPQHLGYGLAESRANFYKGLGSEYLNVQFGWIPFVKDLQAAAKSLLSITETLRQYSRDSGRVVRRRRVSPPITTTTSTNLGSLSGKPIVGARSSVLDGYYAPSITELAPEVTQEDIVSTTYSFSGAYSYHLPVPSGFWEKMERFEAEANRLLGTRVTPSTLWQLSPWSWLIDWHGSLGKVLSNVVSLSGDEQVLRYGYLMRKTVHQRTYRTPSIRFTDGKETGPISHTLRRVTKERVRVNPYGFTLTPGQYNDRQWAILGALGMTKAPRTLH